MDNAAALCARLAGDMRHVQRFILTVDTTVRMVTLPPGGWRLYGAAGPVLFATRAASVAAGTLVSGEMAVPTTATMVAGTAGTPLPITAAYGDGNLSATGTEQGSSVRGCRVLTTDTTLYEELAVPDGSFINLYVRVAASTAAPVLEGPFQ